MSLYFTAKPGQCPRLAPGTVGACAEWCSRDADCSGDLKCCSNGCGHDCRTPGTEVEVRSTPINLPFLNAVCGGRCPDVRSTYSSMLSAVCSNSTLHGPTLRDAPPPLLLLAKPNLTRFDLL